MIANTGAMQNSIYIWTRDHRVHHKYTDTDADPHNINRGFFFAHVRIYIPCLSDCPLLLLSGWIFEVITNTAI
jgi:hypothetical protein